MNGLGVVMALVFFWMVLGIGIVVTIKGAVGLIPRETRIGLIAGGENETGVSVMQELVSKILLATGMLLIYIGGNASFTAMFK